MAPRSTRPSHPRRSHPSTSRPGRLLGLTVGLLAVAATTCVVSPAAQAAEPANPLDGRSQFTAAASCWEIKQKYPASATGVYWLQTPRLVAPEQFYCDMTTDGGGWVLVGRGTYGWQANGEGQGTPAQVRDPSNCTDGFYPKQLSNEVIDGLLNGGRLDTLGDGIRMRRARNTAGTTWQEVRFQVTKAPSWTWAFAGKIPMAMMNFDGRVAYNSGHTSDAWGFDYGYLSANWDNFGLGSSYRPGFAYGPDIRASANQTQCIYSPTGSSPAFPFTQMFIRPRLMSTDAAMRYPSIGAEGSTAVSIGALMQTRAIPSTWGVSGLANGVTNESSPEVSALGELNGVMYVGGNFTTIQNSGATQGYQAYLAAFDVKTGAWISSFRPTLNGQVRSIVGLPNGKLAVGGEFTQVNGRSRVGFVTLEPDTGQTSDLFTVNFEDRTASGWVRVRSMRIQGDWLYVGGSFTHIGGGTRLNTPVWARNAARINVRTATPDAYWNPNFNGTVYSIWPSVRGDRVYTAGFFTNSGGITTLRGAALSSAQGAAPANWTPVFSDSDFASQYQQAVIEEGDKVFLGGAQHASFIYDRDSLRKIGGAVTAVGGDFQSYTASNGTVYGGNHGNEFIYTDATIRPLGGSPNGMGPWTKVDKWSFTGSWSAATMKYQVEFDPNQRCRNGLGAWAMTVDSLGNLWAGGDFTAALNTSGKSQWVGGFVRYAPRDATPPTAPSALSWANTASNSTFTWKAATDNVSGTITYELLVNGRVRATSTTTTLTTQLVPEGNQVVVRARDVAGNRSASTRALTTPTGGAPDPDPDPEGTLVSASASWSYLFQDDTTPSGWTAAGYDDANWRTGKAPLGLGATGMATTLTSPATPRPLTAYFRTHFTVANPASLKGLVITTAADDGIALYVNGKEVNRTNLPEGTLKATTYATAAPRTAAAKSFDIAVPASLLKAGDNVIAAEVHANYRSTPDMSLQLRATAAGDVVPEPEPEPGALVTSGDTWNYRYTTEATPAGWNAQGFDAAGNGFLTGASPIGFGSTGLGTDVDVQPAANRPLTAYFTKQIDVTDPSKPLTIQVPADDGIAVYVNGTEVARANLPGGTLTSSTYASAAPRRAAATANPQKITVPAALLTKGANTIAAEVHLNYKSTPDMTFDMTATQ